MRTKIIEVKNVRKTFKSYEDKVHTLKEVLINWKRVKHEHVEIIKGISFDVHKGEIVGLVGRNGCGKSTTLKMLSNLLKPTSGEIKINGRVSSLIELGAGFHPDMTGRENIYVNASLFGFTKEQIDNKVADIIRFSELEEYIDFPVRVYSSGMYMRLAFSVAISVEPEILLVDEILGVGDAAFQRKCFNKIKSMTESGMTIVIVSHATSQIETLCSRVIWLDNGVIREDGNPRIVCEHYLESMEKHHENRIRKEQDKLIQKYGSEEAAKKANRNLTCRDISEQYNVDAYRGGNGEVEVTSVHISSLDGTPKQKFHRNEPFQIDINYRSHEKNTPVSVTVAIMRDDGVPVYEVSTESDTRRKFNAEKNGHLHFQFNENNMLSGKYYLHIYILGNNGVEYDIVRNIICFKVDCGNCGESGIVSMHHTWTIDGFEASF